ncbi:hypothetical protein QJ857_gp1031 [Tupanvirus soda lake]|uniref:DUF4241 domain-containing protein n=2 Tax=Tupanvirus TaxID=2094720 RepID=A0A6N1NUA2_9VIRU|nr:hypothetical protein QJ857_gp1031 [Tupanvirus soda lake]QKU35023.1 hypothetical protein [Tupanvirus soda lake]
MSKLDNFTIHLGSFVVESGKILVSDPGYDFNIDKYDTKPDAWNLNLLLDSVVNGQWDSWVVVDETTNRNAQLICVNHNKHDNLEELLNKKEWEILNDVICVDSGQAGIYDLDHFKGGDNDEWYEKNCDITLDMDYSAGTISHGVVSSSGYGDGMYDCHIFKINDKTTAIRIIFIDDKKKEFYEKIVADPSNYSDDENNSNDNNN